LKAAKFAGSKWIVVEQDSPSLENSPMECVKMSIDYLNNMCCDSKCSNQCTEEECNTCDKKDGCDKKHEGCCDAEHKATCDGKCADCKK
jgi:hypothetical protein